MSSFLVAYKKWMDRLAKAEAAASMAMMAFLILANGLGIFTRYFLNRPLLWVHELTILVGTWLFYVGMGLLYAAREDISLDLVVNKMPIRMRNQGLAQYGGMTVTVIRNGLLLHLPSLLVPFSSNV